MLDNHEKLHSQRLASMLELLFEKGPLHLYAMKAALKLSNHVAYDTIAYLSKRHLVKIVNTKPFKNTVEKKDYNITAAGMMFLLLQRARSIEHQKFLFYNKSPSEDLDELYRKLDQDKLHQDKSIPYLYPDDNLWDKFFDWTKRQCAIKNIVSPIPTEQFAFFEKSEELLRVFVLLGMAQLQARVERAGVMSDYLKDLPVRWAYSDAFDIGLYPWSRVTTAPSFLSSLLSTRNDNIIDFESSIPASPDFFWNFFFFSEAGRRGDKELLDRDLSLLREQAVDYLQSNPSMVQAMRQIFDMEKDHLVSKSFRMKEFETTLDALKAKQLV